MRTEYSERYITMGLKIAYYRKKAGYTQEVFAVLLAAVNIFGGFMVTYRMLAMFKNSK